MVRIYMANSCIVVQVRLGGVQNSVSLRARTAPPKLLVPMRRHFADFQNQPVYGIHLGLVRGNVTRLCPEHVRFIRDAPRNRISRGRHFIW